MFYINTMRRIQCFIAIYRLVEHKTSGSFMPNSYHLHFCIQFFLCKEKAKTIHTFEQHKQNQGIEER